MHGVALPNNTACIFAAFNDADVGWKESANFRSSIASDECYLADLDGRIEGAKKSEEVGG
jgi:hypothetical protein